MRMAFEISRVLSIVAFLWYGIQLMAFGAMEEDFQRYGLSSYRKTVGTLEVAGALGLIAGYFAAPIGTFAAAGLSIVMCAGLLVRLQFNDPWSYSIPAFILMLMNIFIGYVSFSSSSTPPPS